MAVFFESGPAPRPNSIQLPGTAVIAGSFLQGGNASGTERATLRLELQGNSNVGFVAPNPKFMSTEVIVPPEGCAFSFPVRFAFLPDGNRVDVIIIRVTVSSLDDPGFPDQRFVQIVIDRT